MRLSVNKVCGHRRKKVHSFLITDEGPGPIGPWAHWALGPYGPWAHMGPDSIGYRKFTDSTGFEGQKLNPRRYWHQFFKANLLEDIEK